MIDKVKTTMIALVPAVFLIFAVLGSILAGIASPTEAAGVGAFGAVVLIVAYGRMTWKHRLRWSSIGRSG